MKPGVLTLAQLEAQAAVLEQVLAEARRVRLVAEAARRIKFWDQPATVAGMLAQWDQQDNRPRLVAGNGRGK